MEAQNEEACLMLHIGEEHDHIMFNNTRTTAGDIDLIYMICLFCRLHCSDNAQLFDVLHCVLTRSISTLERYNNISRVANGIDSIYAFYQIISLFLSLTLFFLSFSI
jgi:hypothetical protein